MGGTEDFTRGAPTVGGTTEVGPLPLPEEDCKGADQGEVRTSCEEGGSEQEDYEGNREQGGSASRRASDSISAKKAALPLVKQQSHE